MGCSHKEWTKIVKDSGTDLLVPVEATCPYCEITRLREELAATEERETQRIETYVKSCEEWQARIAELERELAEARKDKAVAAQTLIKVVAKLDKVEKEPGGSG